MGYVGAAGVSPARLRTSSLRSSNGTASAASISVGTMPHRDEQHRRDEAECLLGACHLKGVADEELDGRLVIAREEALQPRGPAPNENHDRSADTRRDGAQRRPGPPGPGRDGRR